MGRLLSIPVQQWVMVALIVGVSVCCCQAHFLVHWLSDPASPPAGQAAAPACCEGCPDDAPLEPGEDTPAPLKSCQACCLKWSGLGEAPVVPTPTVVVWAPLVVAAAHVPPSCPLDARLDQSDRFVEPRTLVRLRCALIV